MSELQEKLLELMITIDEKLNEEKVQYSLIAGSLLGAIREKGFIPWDDDMDIIVKVDEVKKIIDANWPKYIKVVAYKEGLFNLIKIIDTRYEFKINGGYTPLFVDVFFLTKMLQPKYLNKRKKWIKIGNIVFDRLHYLKAKKKGSLLYRTFKTCIILGTLLIPKFLVRKKLLKHYKEGGNYWGVPNWDDCAFIQDWIFKDKDINETIKVNFENKVELSVYKNYIWHIKKSFGDNWETPIKMEEFIHAIGNIHKKTNSKLPRNMKILNNKTSFNKV